MIKLLKRLRLFDGVLGLTAAMAAVLYGLTAILVCAMVAGRYFLNYPLGWVIEICEYILLYSCFLGAAWVLRDDGHVRMDLITDKLSPKHKAAINVVTSIAGIIICAVLTWYSIRSTLNRYHEGAWFDTFLQWPRAPIYAVVPIGFFLLTIEYARSISGHLKTWRSLRSSDTIRNDI